MPDLSLRDGGQMAYLDTGPKNDGMTFLFLHGWVTGAAFFQPQVDALGQSHRLVVPDLRGHGASSPLPIGAGLAALADDIAELVGALGLNHFILVGWSMGATLSWVYMERHGATRVAGLVVEDMTPKVVNEDGWALGARGTVDRVSALPMFERPMASLSKSLVRMSLARENSPAADQVEAYALKAAGNDMASMKALWLDLLDQDHRAFLATCSVPLLMVSGVKSQLYGADVEAWYCGTVPGVRTESFENSGHAPHLEEVEKFNSTIVEFGAGFGLSLPPAY